MMENVIVLKCGGSTLSKLSDRFFKNIQALRRSGFKPIIVHGGGPEIKAMLETLSIESEFVNGLRKTTKEVLDVVEMVLTGAVNNELTRRLNQTKIKSIGLSGSDANLLMAEPKDFEKLGFVGEIIDVNVPLLKAFIEQDIVPVIAPIAIGRDGERYNVNADTVAGAVAKAISAKQLIFVTDVPGILKDGELLEMVSETDIKELIAQGDIYGGMIPKVEAALHSLNDELQEVMIIDGNQALLTENHTTFVGTTIKKHTEVKLSVGSI